MLRVNLDHSWLYPELLGFAHPPRLTATCEGLLATISHSSRVLFGALSSADPTIAHILWSLAGLMGVIHPSALSFLFLTTGHSFPSPFLCKALATLPLCLFEAGCFPEGMLPLARSQFFQVHRLVVVEHGEFVIIVNNCVSCIFRSSTRVSVRDVFSNK